MEDRKAEIFILDFIGVTFLLIAAYIAAAILVVNPEKVINVLVPVVFGGVGLTFLVGTFVLRREGVFKVVSESFEALFSYFFA